MATTSVAASYLNDGGTRKHDEWTTAHGEWSTAIKKHLFRMDKATISNRVQMKLVLFSDDNFGRSTDEVLPRRRLQTEHGK
uniref:Uncharacterized protein n=1 Tax=Cucumis sativus TaxID=3659 RepID=A0A0A0KMD0_CUCSA